MEIITKEEIDNLIESKKVENSILLGEVSRSLGLDINTGSFFSAEKREENKKIFGKNGYKRKKKLNFFQLFKRNSNDKSLIILIFLSIFLSGVSFINNFMGNENKDWIQSISIIFTVFLISFIATLSDLYRNNLILKMYSQQKTSNIQVFRNKTFTSIEESDLTVGDMIFLARGEEIPADCVIVDGKVFVDESLITGESVLIEKNVFEFIYSGTFVTEGNAMVMVLRVGQNSTKGKILEKIDEKKIKTALQIKTLAMALKISNMALFAAIVYFFLKIIFYYKKITLYSVLMFIMEAVSLSAMIIPEGLPITVILTLSIAANKIFTKHNCICKNYRSLEALNNIKWVIFDKTGTLTENVLSLSRCIFLNKETKIFETLDKQEGHENFENLKRGIKQNKLFINNIVLNNRAFLDSSGQIRGNKMDVEIFNFFSMGREFDEITKKIKNESNLIDNKEFCSNEKFSYSVIKKKNNIFQIFIKGAPEKLFPKKKIAEQYLKRSNKLKLRSIGFGFSELNEAEFDNFVENRNLADIKINFLGIFSFEDKLRKGSYTLIEELKSLGINSLMITGDSKEVAENIAQEIKIISAENKKTAIDASEIYKISDYQLLMQIFESRVIYRAKPNDKKKIVKLLQSFHHQVAFIGDGANDGPAISAANVGFTFGNMGCDISKSAADIIIMNDNILSVLKCVYWGRSISKTIRKFLQFQISTSLNLFFICVLLESFFKVQIFSVSSILLLNIFVDTFSAVSFGFEEPNKDVIKSSPEDIHKELITRNMKKNILFGFFNVFIIFFLMLFTKNSSIIANVFVFMTIISKFCMRALDCKISSLSNIQKNKIFIFICLSSLLIQMILTQNCSFIYKTRLSVKEWGIVFVVSSILPVIYSIRRHIELKILN